MWSSCASRSRVNSIVRGPVYWLAGKSIDSTVEFWTSNPGSSACARCMPRTSSPALASSITLIATCTESNTLRSGRRARCAPSDPDPAFNAAEIPPRVPCSAGARPNARQDSEATAIV